MRGMVLAAIIVMIVACGCTKDTSTSPETPEEIPLAVDTLDAGGGRLEIDDFALIVPPGAFDSPVVLSLYESSEDHCFGDNAVSRLFRLEGLPEDFSDSLTVRIRYQGTLEGATYIASGMDAEVLVDEMDMVEETVYRLLPAREDAGYLEASIPPNDAASRSRSGKSLGISSDIASTRHYIATHNYSILNSEHIQLHYPIEVKQYADAVIAHFEGGHDKVEDIGVGYEGRPWEWPVAEVAIMKLGGTRMATCRTESRQARPLIVINQDKISDAGMPKLQFFAMMLMMNVAVLIPDSEAYLEPDNVWWHFGVVTWSGLAFGGTHAPERPRDLSGNEIKALAGFPLGLNNKELAVKHGYAWTAIVAYLTQRYGNDILGGIYERVRAGSRPAAALVESLPEPAYNWWPHFVDRYLNGHIYDVDSDVLLMYVDSSDRFRIQYAHDILWEGLRDYNQLSARIFRIIPDYSEIDKSAGLELSISYTGVDPDYISLLVYTDKDGVLTYVGEGDTVHVRDLQRLTVEGHEIIPLMVNSFTEEPYNGKMPIKLTARVTKQAYNHCSINIGTVSAEFINDDDVTRTDEEWSIRWEGEGTFDGNTFIASWENRPEPGGHLSSGELSVAIDPATLDVVSFSAQKIFTYSTGDQIVDRVSGGAVAFGEIASEPNAYLSCREIGGHICTNISLLEYTLTYHGTGKWEELTEIVCGAESSIYVTFWYWEGQ